MKIELKENKILIDGEEKQISDLNTELLNSILEKAIKQEVEYVLTDTTSPVYSFFVNLERDTKVDSDFMQELNKLEEQKDVEESEEETESLFK